MRSSLEGRFALVTGASRGIGQAIALGLAQSRADLLLWFEPGEEDAADAVIEKVEAAGAMGSKDAVDVSSPEAIREGFRAIDHRGRTPNVVINNAGVIGRSAPEEVNESDWDAILSVNLIGPLLVCQEAAARMARDSYGKIVNVASVLSFGGGATVPVYAISKGGIRSMTHALAHSLAPFGVRVNAIAPGHTRTRLTRPAWDDEVRRASLTTRIPLGRWGEPEDMVSAALYLSGPSSDAVTGHTLVIDGGWLAG
jgi:2-dehydro-3-deoxy-D-gluconate 5-dehydrogenase